MAIYNVEYLDEQVQDNETEDMLDGMLEACDAMMQMVESTAAQRHYGMTSKDYDRYYGDEAGKRATKFLDDDNRKGRSYVNKMAKATRPDKLDKTVNRSINLQNTAAKFLGRKDGYTGMTDREKEEAAVQAKAALKGASGSVMGKAARSGYDVKGTFDKAKEKDAKKKAIKETCLNILSIIDEL